MNHKLNRAAYCELICDDIEKIVQANNSDHRHALKVLHDSVHMQYDLLPAAVQVVTYFACMGQIPRPLLQAAQTVLTIASYHSRSTCAEAKEIKLRGVVNHGWPTS